MRRVPIQKSGRIDFPASGPCGSFPPATHARQSPTVRTLRCLPMDLYTRTASTKAVSVPRSRIYSRCVTLRATPRSLLTRPTRARTVLKVRDLQSHSYGLRAELVRLPDSLLSHADSFFQGLLADKEALATELAERRARRARATSEQTEAKRLRLQAVQADIEAKKAELKRWHEVSRRLRGMSG